MSQSKTKPLPLSSHEENLNRWADILEQIAVFGFTCKFEEDYILLLDREGQVVSRFGNFTAPETIQKTVDDLIKAREMPVMI